ncbi:hypothetical protein D3C76_1667270 [compost metagenome]
MIEAPPLAAQEVSLVLKYVALGVHTMHRVGQQSWREIYEGNMSVEVDGWLVTLFNDCNTLDYCEECKRSMNPTFKVLS